MQPNADAAVAIPWFNNIWFNDATGRRTSSNPSAAPTSATPSAPRLSDATRPDRHSTPSPQPAAAAAASSSPTPTPQPTPPSPSPSRRSSSRHTISTLSAIERISLISLLSAGHPSASDVLRTLSDPDLMQFTHTHPSPTVTLPLHPPHPHNNPSTATAAAAAAAAVATLSLPPIRSAPLIRPKSSAAVPPRPARGNPSPATTQPACDLTIRRAASTPPLPRCVAHTS